MTVLRRAVRLLLALLLISGASALAGCDIEDALKPAAATFTEVTPEGNGEINGFLSGVGSDRGVDASGAVAAVRVFSIRWDAGTSDSTFLLTTETALELAGRDLSSAPASEKAAALSRLTLDGESTPVYVRYQANSASRTRDPLGYRYPVAQEVVVSELN